MDRSSFTAASPGKPLKLKKGKWAFSPNPPPSHLTADWETASHLSMARRTIGRLEGYVAAVGLAQKPVRSILLFQEGANSLKLEGMEVDATRHFQSAISASDAGGNTEPDAISLFLQAYNSGLEYLKKDLPPSIDLILKLYSTIFQTGSPMADQPSLRTTSGADLGTFRRISDNFQYIPPPEPQLKMALYSLDKHFRRPGTFPDLIDFILVFYQIIAIQPFAKGNIATACLLTNILISNTLKSGIPPAPISPFIRAQADGLSEAFIQVVKSGDWCGWIRFFLKGITHQFEKARDTAERVVNLRNEYFKWLEKQRTSSALAQLVDDIFTQPVITVGQASRLARVTFRAAQFNVDKLAELEILRETTGQKRNRVYLAPEIISIYEGNQP